MFLLERRRVAERELLHLHAKIDKLLDTLEEGEPEQANSQEDECVICVNARATMTTSPCGHRVVCRRCFVKTIQTAVAQRLLPLRCVVCRAKILRLRHAGARLTSSRSTPVVSGSASCYSVGARSVPASASLYSVTSGESSLSGVSSVSSGSGVSAASTACGARCAGSRCDPACLGAAPRRNRSRKEPPTLLSYTGGAAVTGEGRLPPIREFQREFREGRRDMSAPRAPPAPAAAEAPSSRVRCARKIVTRLEERARAEAAAAARREEKRAAAERRRAEAEAAAERKRAEAAAAAERRREEKARQKAEKEARRLAKEEDRRAKQRAREEEKKAKQLAKQKTNKR